MIKMGINLILVNKVILQRYLCYSAIYPKSGMQMHPADCEPFISLKDHNTHHRRIRHPRQALCRRLYIGNRSEIARSKE